MKFSARLGLYEDETSALCHWHIPQTHFLEEWGDARAFDGTVSIIQPLIAPLYDGKSAHELIALLSGQRGESESRHRAGLLEERSGPPRRKRSGATRRGECRRGFVRHVLEEDAARRRDGRHAPSRRSRCRSRPASPRSRKRRPPGLEIIFRPDPTIWDGRFANNGWLQELPKPLTKLTWDSVAMFSPETAGRLGLKNEDAVELKYQGRTIRAPVWVMPGHADESVTVFLGLWPHAFRPRGHGRGF